VAQAVVHLCRKVKALGSNPWSAKSVYIHTYIMIDIYKLGKGCVLIIQLQWSAIGHT
jgi:hypothetical protein